jgi:hypothetical protein
VRDDQRLDQRAGVVWDIVGVKRPEVVAADPGVALDQSDAGTRAFGQKQER